MVSGDLGGQKAFAQIASTLLRMTRSRQACTDSHVTIVPFVFWGGGGGELCSTLGPS